MFRHGSLVRLWFRSKKKNKKEGIFEISKKVRNTIFTCTKKTHVSRVPILHFFSKYLKRISWCVYSTVQFVDLGATLINLFTFLLYTLFLWKYYSKLHHRLKTCVCWEFTRKTLCFCCSLKKFHGLTKYVVPPSIKHKTSKNQPTNQKQANVKQQK